MAPAGPGQGPPRSRGVSSNYYHRWGDGISLGPAQCAPHPRGRRPNLPLGLAAQQQGCLSHRERVLREALCTVLRALPSERAPVLGIDVALDDDGPQPVQPVATKALAALIQAQRRKVLFNITMHDNDKSQRPGAVDVASLPSRVLLAAALQHRCLQPLALTLISLQTVPVSLGWP